MQVGLIFREGSDDAPRLAAETAAWLKARGHEARFLDSQAVPGFPGREEKDWAVGIGLAVVLGGDGTLLRAAQLIQSPEIRVVGVKMGGLGFLTEVVPSELFPVLEDALAGKGRVTERMVIECSITGREGKNFLAALNEISITCAGIPRIINLKAWVDGVFVNEFRADGLLVSTPTGSTAYCMAAGGPIVHPALRCMTILPICPHTLTSRPLVVPAESTIAIVVKSSTAAVHINADSQKTISLEPEDKVEIKASPHGLALISSPTKSYYEILRTKLRWGER